jgi:hypothetical protein
MSGVQAAVQQPIEVDPSAVSYTQQITKFIYLILKHIMELTVANMYRCNAVYCVRFQSAADSIKPRDMAPKTEKKIWS